MPNRKERKTNSNDVKPCSTTGLVEMFGIHSWDKSKPHVKTAAITSDHDHNFKQIMY